MFYGRSKAIPLKLVWLFGPCITFLIILASIAVAPFVYRLSVKHLSKKKYTRDDYVNEATWCACFALVFTVLATFNLDDHKTAAGRWLVPVVWTIATAIPLFMAFKAKKTEHKRHE